MKRIIAFGMILALTVIVSAEDKKEEYKGNVCYTESVEVSKGTSFPVRVFVNNTDTLAGMQVPIYYRSEDVDLVCDSVSYVGSRCEAFSLSHSMIEPVGKVVFFAFISMTDPAREVAPLYPADGLVATLWFTAGKDIKSGKVELYSGPNAIYPHDKIDYSYLFWTPGAEQKDCLYRPGYITIK